MPKITTDEMIRAAMFKAVETNLIPRYSLLAEYLKAGSASSKYFMPRLRCNRK